jgi:membrane-bound serine protease (ClpP class)
LKELKEPKNNPYLRQKETGMMKQLRQGLGRKIQIGICFLFLMLGFVSLAHSSQNTNTNAQGGIYVLDISGPIGPALYNYMKKGFEQATKNQADLIVLELNTPGGLLTTTREMTTLILNSDVPVAVHVTPAGSHAASAGTFLVYASHIAAMAEGTNLGAATPIAMGAPQEKNPKSKDEKPQATDAKALEDTKAFIRGLAEMRGRNIQWAEKAVTEALSLTATEAKKQNVIEYVANSRDDLIKQIDGKKIKIRDDKSVTLDLKNAPIIDLKPDLKTQILTAITDPNIAMILISIGITGLTLEFYNPGTFVAGTIGVICLLLGFYAMNILPINMAGLFLILLAAGLILAEVFVPSFGILGIGGIIAFVLGSTMIFEGDAMPGLQLEWGVVAGIATTMLLIMIIFAVAIGRSVLKKSTTGTEAMIGEHALILEWQGKQGRVQIEGEIWQAVAETDYVLALGDKVKITRIDKLTATIQP